MGRRQTHFPALAPISPWQFEMILHLGWTMLNRGYHLGWVNGDAPSAFKGEGHRLFREPELCTCFPNKQNCYLIPSSPTVIPCHPAILCLAFEKAKALNRQYIWVVKIYKRIPGCFFMPQYTIPEFCNSGGCCIKTSYIVSIYSFMIGEQSGTERV